MSENFQDECSTEEERSSKSGIDHQESDRLLFFSSPDYIVTILDSQLSAIRRGKSNCDLIVVPSLVVE